jgi:hypothetical protein
VARRLEQTGKRVPKSPSFSNLSSKASYSPSQNSFHAPPPTSPVALPGGPLQRSPPLSPGPPPASSMRPPPLVLPSEPQMFPQPSGEGPSPQVQGLITTPQLNQGVYTPAATPSAYAPTPSGYGPVKYQGLPPGPPAYGQSMYYSPQQMGGAQGMYLTPGTGQPGWGAGPMVNVESSLQVPADDDSTEANAFRELEGSMRNVSDRVYFVPVLLT